MFVCLFLFFVVFLFSLFFLLLLNSINLSSSSSLSPLAFHIVQWLIHIVWFVNTVTCVTSIKIGIHSINRIRIYLNLELNSNMLGFVCYQILIVFEPVAFVGWLLLRFFFPAIFVYVILIGRDVEERKFYQFQKTKDFLKSPNWSSKWKFSSFCLKSNERIIIILLLFCNNKQSIEWKLCMQDSKAL